MNSRALSLRLRLMVGILVPLLIVFVIVGYLSYQRALEASSTAYDRTLLASAKTIGELLSTTGAGDNVRVTTNLMLSALEPFESDNRSRLVYHVSGFASEHVSGDPEFPKYAGTIPNQSLYAALVDFYNIEYRGEPMRVAVLLQPVAGIGGVGMATVQVAETLELRTALARDFLWDFLRLQGLAITAIAALVLWVVWAATRPVRLVGQELRARDDQDLTPISTQGLPRELTPLIDATNQVMQRLSVMLKHQKRFVRDTAHQLRTPLAVLRTQVQSAQRGDLPLGQAIDEIGLTVNRATLLANQMLDLAKVEQVRNSTEASQQNWDEIVRSVALDLAPLIAEKGIDFSITTQAISITSHQWMLQELTRNLLHNAIIHAPNRTIKNALVPPSNRLSVQLYRDDLTAVLRIANDGPPIPQELNERLFQPFSRGSDSGGSGLGLAICKEICQALNGSLQLENQIEDGKPSGVVALARVPLPV